MSLLVFLSACTEFETPIPPVTQALPPPPAAPRSPPQIRSNLPPPPNVVRAETYRWFIKAGYRSFQAEALMNHAAIESGFRPCAAGPAGLRYLFQWGGRRLRQLQQFAGYEGCPQLETQLTFADKELRGSAKYACFWYATTTSGALAALRRGFGGGSC